MGRPPVRAADKIRIIAAWQQYGSVKKTAKELGKAYATVHKIVAAHKEEVAKSGAAEG